MTDSRNYDFVVVGGGVTGTAVLYVLSRFTNARRLALVEEYPRVAQVNSHPRNNSQTLHFGDIETNYNLEHALPVQDAARLMMNYVLANPAPGLHQLTEKMVLAVGDEEVAAIRKRYQDFLPHYPGLELVEAPALAELEPAVMEGRDPQQPVVALLSHDGYAINYQLLSESFLQNALSSDREVEAFFDTKVQSITRQEDGSFIVQAGTQELRAKAVVVCAGPWSLIFAQDMGYAPELAFISVAGSFYFTDQRKLKNKVYTFQIDGIPFAAIHGDPDVAVYDQTRFGPTAKVIPLLERHRYGTMWAFFRRTKLFKGFAGVLALLSIAIHRPVMTRFIVKNLFYDVPVVGKWLYLRQMRKIVPGLRWREVTLGRKLGGVRPQIIDTKKREMLMGESTIIEPGIVFNTTPSPGASVALKNAEANVRALIGYLGDGYVFDQDAFDRKLRRASTEEDVTA